ncbi:MAG: hypothetical protein QOG21_80, partial [Actinomycetota bacterium]|nr:hypothetical protein [Actinomycetota bacterium]
MVVGSQSEAPSYGDPRSTNVS